MEDKIPDGLAKECSKAASAMNGALVPEEEVERLAAVLHDVGVLEADGPAGPWGTGEPIRVEEIEGFIDRLSGPAQKLYEARMTDVDLQVNIAEPPLLSQVVFDPQQALPEDQGYVRRRYRCQFFSKLAYVEEFCSSRKEVLASLEPYIKALARTFNWLVKKDLVGLGVLSNAMLLKLAQIEVRDRYLLLLYVFPSVRLVESLRALHSEGSTNLDLEHAEVQAFLNRELGSKCFAEEGDMGDDDWESLPST
jgi:hypothetical protein